MLAQALDGAHGPDAAHLNNASFLTLPDGYPALLQMYLFSGHDLRAGTTAPTTRALVYHEYTHGLSERLVTDARASAR